MDFSLSYQIAWNLQHCPIKRPSPGVSFRIPTLSSNIKISALFSLLYFWKYFDHLGTSIIISSNLGFISMRLRPKSD